MRVQYATHTEHSRSVRRRVSAELRSAQTSKAQVEELLTEVDHFRGVPEFYWGVQSLIQSKISSV